MSSAVQVTVVIPAYDRAHLLGRAIDSVLGQTLTPAAVIVVDDGSVDDTKAVVQAYGDEVRYVWQLNAGGAAARNHGVKLAETEWVAFLDSDDLWLPNHLELLAEAVEGTAGAADIYFGDVERTVEEGGGSTFFLAGLEFEGSCLLRSDALGWAVAERQPAMIQGTMMRRAAFMSIGGFWPALSSRHDTHFFYFVFATYPACAVAGPTVRMTADENVGNRLTGGSGNRSQRYWECTIRLYRDVLHRRSNTDERTVAHNLLCRGHKRLARAQWADGERAASLLSSLRGIGTSPTGFLLSFLPGGRLPPRVRRARERLVGLTVGG